MMLYIIVSEFGSVSMSSDLRGGAGGGAGVNDYVYTHIIMAHIIMYARNSTPPCMEVGGAYGGRWASDGVHVTRQTL